MRFTKQRVPSITTVKASKKSNKKGKKPPKPKLWRDATGAGRLVVPVIALSLTAVAVSVYLSPSSQRPAAFSRLEHSASASSSASSTRASYAAPSTRVVTMTETPTITEDPSTTQPAPATVTVRASVTAKVTRTVVTVKSVGPKAQYCTQFPFQQDAQAAYVSNLSDPYGLDGKPGPHNGDGVACTQLPVDPNRPPSAAVDPYVAPSPATKAVLMAPDHDYYGITENGLPNDTTLLDQLDTTVGVAPSEIGWFSYWDSGYDASKVRTAWSRGALPMITWLSVPADSHAPGAANYTLANIANGQFDTYLLQYAGAILSTGLPVAIRLDHEMNGNWFPWAAGLPANQPSGSGQPNQYVRAWRHIWNLFQSVGANADVIWTWAPNRVDTLKPGSHSGGTSGQTSLAEDYPGDSYVDWLGLSAYTYKPSDGWTFGATYAKSLTALKSLSNKPIFIAETGATEAVGAVDYAVQKAQWTTQVLAGLVNDSAVVGFSWFNNSVTGVHTVDGVVVDTNWQFTSSPQALAAFQAGIADPRYASGVMPDGLGG
jgi:mannan endo-1,4-beta-mannosidase